MFSMYSETPLVQMPWGPYKMFGSHVSPRFQCTVKPL